MARQNRKFTPRLRTTRPLGAPLTTNAPPMQPHSPPIFRDQQWIIEPPLSSRLYQKSGIGLMQSDGSIRLCNEEILFCHWHRHVPLPSKGWFENQVRHEPNIIARSIIFDTARSGGELLIPCENIPDKWGLKYNEATWALRWNREQIFSKEAPVAHVRWAWTTDDIDWMKLIEWTADVHALGMQAELFVIDEELDVTMYLLSESNPNGNQPTWESLAEAEVKKLSDLWDLRIQRGEGWYIPNSNQWPWDSLGVEHLSGRHLRHEEGLFLDAKLSDTSLNLQHQLYGDLMERGVVLRPGFKYGSVWRVYETSVGDAHAPWLVQPSSRAPMTWEGACLAVRLSEGVNKQWICALLYNKKWFYLQVQRWLPGRT